MPSSLSDLGQISLATSSKSPAEPLFAVEVCQKTSRTLTLSTDPTNEVSVTNLKSVPAILCTTFTEMRPVVEYGPATFDAPVPPPMRISPIDPADRVRSNSIRNVLPAPIDAITWIRAENDPAVHEAIPLPIVQLPDAVQLAPESNVPFVTSSGPNPPPAAFTNGIPMPMPIARTIRTGQPSALHRCRCCSRGSLQPG